MFLFKCWSISLSACVYLGVVSPYRAQVRLIKDLLAVSVEEGRVLEYPIYDMKVDTRPPTSLHCIKRVPKIFCIKLSRHFC